MEDHSNPYLTSMRLQTTSQLFNSFWKQRFDNNQVPKFFLCPNFVKGDIFGGWPLHGLVQNDSNTQLIHHEMSQRKGTLLSSYVSSANFETWEEVSRIAETYPNVTFGVTLGLSTYPYNDKNINFYNLKQQLLSMPDNVHLCFFNGWDMYSDEHLDYDRLGSFQERFKELDNKRLEFFLCNQKILEKAKKYFPGCYTEYYSIYPVRMIDSVGYASHPKYFCKEEKFRTRKLISLNNHVKPHRLKIVDTLRPFLETKEVYLSLRGMNLFLDREQDMPYSKNDIFIEQLQDAPPRRVMTNSYAYVATETHFNSEEAMPMDHLPGGIENWKNIPNDKYYSWFTEKQMKAFYYELPFLHVGYYRNLEEIRKLGFVTFPEFFDESYDHIYNDRERIKAICKTMLDYMEKSLEEIHELFWSPIIQEKLRHNKDRFLKLVERDPFNKYYGLKDGIHPDGI